MHQNHIVFATSTVGASHLPKGTPCQDYSLCEDVEGVHMIIICDGHGSKTYVRSDIGARLAAEITKELVLQFVSETSPELFIDKRGAVTARPAADDNLWGAIPNKPLENMTEIELMSHQQDKSFFEQVKDIREQDAMFVALFNNIYSEWLKAIQEDSKSHPFTDKEKESLGDKNLVKAYGTTLMAFIETPFYWFSFHIGDGRIISVSNLTEMTDPVPWDCNCFQNYTTSLCNSNPVRLFRYAFDGTGRFPAAVFCCSDGIEDSYGDYTLAPQYLHNWYWGLLNEFVTKGAEETLKNIKVFLPLLSQKGSKDDMSLAGIIHLDHIPDILKAVDIKNQMSEQDKNKEQLLSQVHEIKTTISESEKNALKVVEIKKQISDLDKQKELLQSQLNQIEAGIEESKHIALKVPELNKQISELDKQKEQLQLKLNEIEIAIAESDKQSIKQWRLKCKEITEGNTSNRSYGKLYIHHI